MPKLRRIRTALLIKLCEKHGYRRARQRGSHVSLTKPGVPRPIVIPIRHQEALPYLIAQVIAHLGITIDDYHKEIIRL
ncbi:MAG TPA: type II toxin-antitoxin system HicA family toxin [bacterium]|nr:type II toxin-antitoxin system HicA family toxin [bacterium]